jgi:hypothetical protein
MERRNKEVQKFSVCNKNSYQSGNENWIAGKIKTGQAQVRTDQPT